MEWVETTGRTVDDAKESALDQLGVDEQDAEFEIVAEPRPGLFGRLRGEARVRARVRPSRPRPKVERRDRRRRGEARRSGPAAVPANGDTREADAVSDAASEEPPGRQAEPGADEQERSSRRRRRGGRGRGGAARRSPDDGEAAPTDAGEGSDMGNDATVEGQAEITRTFLTGLLEAFELRAQVAEERLDEETIEVQVLGEGLGLLIGPKGQTLQAVQELARTSIQRQASGIHHGRVRIDVAGYRQRRRDALERFARQVADDVRASGVQRALEPMHPMDRKVVHDAINEIEGVSTTSEGVEPFRRVVILPEGAGAHGAAKS
jgi:spoIIIJ-associated protein